jgi:FMN phosphatase YigB (HAD superfamily)
MNRNHNFPEENTNLRSVDFQGVKLVSFDFFDTVVYRDSVTHLQLWKNFSKKYFFARFKSEVIARALKRARGIPEISQEDIYSRMPTAWRLEFELSLEQQSLSINPIIERVMRAAQGAGAKVCIISDTHFRATDIEKILLGLKISNVQVFTSGDHALTKSTGLFSKIQSILNVTYEDWVHVGDNPKSDLRSPEELGIKAIYYPHMKHQLVKSGLVSARGYNFLRKSGRSGNAAIAAMFYNLLLNEDQLYEEQFKTPKILGSVIGNLVSKSIANQVHKMHLQNHFDCILYSSRDGWLPYLAHKQMFKSDPIVYFKTSRSMLDDQRFNGYLKSIVGDSKRVLIYDIGWRGTTAQKITKSFPWVTWDFVYWQILGDKTPFQHELNPGGYRNRSRIWRSRDFLEALFTDESSGFDGIRSDLVPQERNTLEDDRYKAPILAGATRDLVQISAEMSLLESSLILEAFARFPSNKLISHFDGMIHHVNDDTKGLLVTTTWRQLFSRSRILWSFGSRLSSGVIVQSQIFTSIVLIKEVSQRLYNLFIRLTKSN